MATRSKAYRAAVEKIHPGELYAPLDAMKLAKETSTTKFDATVEVMFRLSVDPRKADQMVRGLSLFRMAPVRPPGSWSLPLASALRRRSMLARMRLAATSSLRRFRAVTPTLMSLLLPRT